MPAFIVRTLRRISRIGLTVCVIGGLLAGTVGFTIAPPSLVGARFPCDGHACGCRSAADCWAGCCCLSPAQRLEWARSHGVKPPASLLKLVRSDGTPEKGTPTVASRRSAGHCCASHGSAKSCCAAKAKRQTAQRSKSHRGVSPICESSHCHGPGQWWVSGSQPLALPERPLTFTLGAVVSTVTLLETDYSRDAQSPPTRPG